MLFQNVALFLDSSPIHRRLSRSTAAWRALVVAAAWVVLAARPCAASPALTFTGAFPGPRPFISLVTYQVSDAARLDYIQFTIEPKPGSRTRPIKARYSSAYLSKRGYLKAQTGALILPVFGLYAGFTNSVQLVFGFVDGKTEPESISIPTAKYGGGIYSHPHAVQPRLADTTLSYDFILLKSYADTDSPKVIDTDGELRWVGTAYSANPEAIVLDNAVFVDSVTNTGVDRIEWDGAVSNVGEYAALGVTALHHNFDFGKRGILLDVDTADYTESAVMEIDVAGHALQSWNMASIITAAMVAGGDDPALFVSPPGVLGDWCHVNSAAYRASDDSLVISSRENFVIALDYSTGAIKWILGDPTKQWHQFPSLRKYALTTPPGTQSHYPIGQHALSFVADHLLLFDDGFGSLSHVPAGKSRTYSAPRKYVIDQAAGTATETWHYLASPAIFSPVASSVYEDQPGNYLIDYATGGPFLFAEIMGLDATGAKAFDYKFAELELVETAWNAVPLHLENLILN
jgi:arylsulfate sulfotransferase